MISLEQQLVYVCTLPPMLLLKGELEHVFSYYTMILLKKAAGTFLYYFHYDIIEKFLVHVSTTSL